MAAAAAEDGGSLFAPFHFFPFGAFARSAAWARALADGRFAVTADGRIALD